MKTDIHPEYVDATIVCSCGHTVHTRSTKADLHVEICSNCHPFYTGKQKFIDSGGRLDRFQKRLAVAGSSPEPQKKNKAKVRTFAPAVDPKVLKAKADRAAAKAREDAEKRKAEEVERKAEAAAQADAKAQAKAEAASAAKAARTDDPGEAAAGDATATDAATDAPVADDAS